MATNRPLRKQPKKEPPKSPDLLAARVKSLREMRARESIERELMEEKKRLWETKYTPAINNLFPSETNEFKRAVDGFISKRRLRFPFGELFYFKKLLAFATQHGREPEVVRLFELLSLHCPDKATRSNVIFGLGKIGSNKAVSILGKLLKDPFRSTRFNAINALDEAAKRNRDSVVSLLKKALNNKRLPNSERTAYLNILKKFEAKDHR